MRYLCKVCARVASPQVKEGGCVSLSCTLNAQVCVCTHAHIAVCAQMHTYISVCTHIHAYLGLYLHTHSHASRNM